MGELVSTSVEELRESARAVAREVVRPEAARCDREEWIRPATLRRLAELGCFGAGLPEKWGGGGLDAISHGVLHEEIGRESASVEGILNVHHMASHAISRWGGQELEERWLPALASGEMTAGLALTEPDAGSDLASVATTATSRGSAFLLSGTKRFITAGQSADVFLVLARCDDQLSAFIVPSSSPGLEIIPIRAMLGCRGYMLAELRFSECEVPEEDRVGSAGFGLSAVALTAVDAGRYCLSWACVGLGQACVDASLEFASTRRQFGVPIQEHQLIQELVTDQVVEVKAARGLCLEAGRQRQERLRSATTETSIAKYYASRMAGRAAAAAVQIHGARGCSSEYPVERYLRDSKIMEIVEGSSQIQQVAISRKAFQFGAAAAVTSPLASQ